ncbi:MAG: isopentenyl-diphosphate Delta-isomerase [Planctomycetota bacterium]
MSEPELILVDENDNVVGYSEKLAAHLNGGKLHRAFSIVIYDLKGRMLLQKRAASKYHFGGFWTNACCSHPLRGEELEDTVHRRLIFEMGFDTPLRQEFSFIYRAEDEASGLVEHELDRVFTGTYDGAVKPNPDEVEDYKWIDMPELLSDLETSPENYTPWFKILMKQLSSHSA